MRAEITTDIMMQFTVLKEGGKFIFYAPALEMSTYGKTFEQAQKRAREMVEIFIEETLARGTLKEALQELGWKIVHKKGQRSWVPPQIIAQSAQAIQIPVPA